MFYLCFLSLWWIVLTASPVGRTMPRAITEIPAYPREDVAHPRERRTMRGRATDPHTAARRAHGV
jgi:hypothetical protein